MPDPRERHETVRESLRSTLTGDAAYTARELSERIGVSERDVMAHLEHLGRGARGHGDRLVVEPARCGDCGFEFKKRERLSRPSRCPVCKSERVDAPRFRLQQRG